MSWKCDFCPQRIFITKTSYTNYIKQCLESVDSSEELSLEVMIIDSLESENLLNNENNFENIHENSNENEDEDDDSNNAEAEEESLTSNISHSSILFFENMELSNSDAENYSFNNYASDNNNICEKTESIEFPNNAYADLIALILTHNNIDYYLFYHPVLNCIKNILSISDISQNFTLRFENFKVKKLTVNNTLEIGTEASLPDSSKLLSIILYFDATTTDTLGKSSLHPIYISIGNISTKRCNKSDAKQLLGYLPILKAKDKFEKKSKDFKKLVRLTFNNSMKFLLDPLFAKKGIDLEFFSRISTIIYDWPEAATFSLIYKSINSNFPYHFYLISKTLLSNTDLSDITFRNNENIQEYFYNDVRQDVSLENIPNYFWSLPSINIYTATVPDRIYHLDLELFHYQIKFTQALLQKQDSSLIGKIDDRLSKIPRFQKFQMFTNGLQSISRMTAKEYRILMKVMVFVVDNLYEENKNNVKDFIENRKLSEVYAKWNKMYMMSRSEIFTEKYFYNDVRQDVSLENIPNYFWSLPSINIYTATVPDRIYHLDLELFHYQIKFTQALLQKQDSSLIGKIDDRLSKIPRFQKFQMFTNGLQSISRMTAKEYRILMKVMVFVVDNLYEENKNNVKDFIENRKLSEVYAKWNKMYMMSRSEIFTESDLENFQACY
ncbi:hypothetical protein Glove_166g127 [Diversispora epigaea]|uniref:Uncharacterized protein n=1 Tax=Diversispora epigaea TaxID=1348612 RepID=A0A397J010_9GLOM|nr:hypothetical protein Glove_166g127 [Diversispora epigaea]